MNPIIRLIKAGMTAAKERALRAGLIRMPKSIKGANCSNCSFWKNTSNEEIGYCGNSDISMFVTNRQICNAWTTKGAIARWDNKPLARPFNFRDTPPQAPSEFETDKNGGYLFESPEALMRAKSQDIISLPLKVEGINCGNCKHSSSEGWCKQPGVNQPIEKRDSCNFWEHPGMMRAKWSGLSKTQEDRVEDRTNAEMSILRNEIEKIRAEIEMNKSKLLVDNEISNFVNETTRRDNPKE
jgi:hypothetical protein